MPDRSTPARLAKASERLSILAHELQIAVSETSDPGTHVDMLAEISGRLSSQVLDLAEITFAVAEDVVSLSGDPRAERSAAALGRVSRIIEPVFETASEVAAHLVICAEQAVRAQESLTALHLSSLDSPITELLAANRNLITGAGVAAAPNALGDEELWMQWWVQGPFGPIQLRPQLDPSAAHFYDYPSAVWFSESARDLAPHLAPPHFDDGGTDTWMVTATVPVVVRDRLIGLACAELTLKRIGALVAPALQAMPAPAALVSPEGLVVASTHPRMVPGLPASDDHWVELHATAPFTELSPDITIARSPTLPWRLVADWALAARA
jgi:hypothetical protein